MKNIFVTLAIATMLFACSDEPTTPSKTGTISETASLTGTWTFEKQTQANGKNYVDGELESTFTAESSEETGTFQFNDEGTYGSNYGYKNTFAITAGPSEGSKETQTPPTASGGTYVYDKTAGTITFTVFTGEVINATISELTETSLVFTNSLTVSETNSGVTTTSTSDVTTTLSR